MKKNVLSLFAILLLLGVFIISCDEDLLNLDTDVSEEEEQTIADNTEAELKVARVFEYVSEFGISTNDGKKNVNLDGCPTVAWEGLTLTLDFASCADGTSGKIIATFSASPFYSTSGLTADVTFDNFVLESTGMDGRLELTITGLAPGGDVGPTFRVKVLEDLTFTEGSDSHIWKANSERTFKWLQGFSTLDNNGDDVYALDGNSSGVNSDGTPYEVNITTALVFDMSCEYLPEGVMELVNDAGTDDESKITIDFSVGASDSDPTGQCDSWVKVTKGSFSVTMDINDL